VGGLCCSGVGGGGGALLAVAMSSHSAGGPGIGGLISVTLANCNSSYNDITSELYGRWKRLHHVVLEVNNDVCDCAHYAVHAEGDAIACLLLCGAFVWVSLGNAMPLAAKVIRFPALVCVMSGAAGGGLGVIAETDNGVVSFAATNVSASFNSVTGGSGGEVLPVGMMHPLAVLMDWWVVLAQWLLCWLAAIVVLLLHGHADISCIWEQWGGFSPGCVTPFVPVTLVSLRA
jgi:hypothetical protein